MTRTEIGDIEMSYEMQPCGLNGQPVNGGNHYANAKTIEDARAYAHCVLGVERFMNQYVLGSVRIIGREMRFEGHAWVSLKGGRYESETVYRAQTASR